MLYSVMLHVQCYTHQYQSLLLTVHVGDSTTGLAWLTHVVQVYMQVVHCSEVMINDKQYIYCYSH